LTPPAARTQELDEMHTEFAIMGAPVYGGRIPIDAVGRLRRLNGHYTPAVVHRGDRLLMAKHHES
jgi:hypothetical protein